MKIRDKKEREGSIWSGGYFAETMGEKGLKEKMKTFHMKHNEDVNYSCAKCDTKISAHNRDWHAGLCDNCFYGERSE